MPDCELACHRTSHSLVELKACYSACLADTPEPVAEPEAVANGKSAGYPPAAHPGIEEPKKDRTDLLPAMAGGALVAYGCRTFVIVPKVGKLLSMHCQAVAPKVGKTAAWVAQSVAASGAGAAASAAYQRLADGKVDPVKTREGAEWAVNTMLLGKGLMWAWRLITGAGAATSLAGSVANAAEQATPVTQTAAQTAAQTVSQAGGQLPKKF